MSIQFPSSCYSQVPTSNFPVAAEKLSGSPPGIYYIYQPEEFPSTLAISFTDLAGRVQTIYVGKTVKGWSAFSNPHISSKKSFHTIEELLLSHPSLFLARLPTKEEMQALLEHPSHFEKNVLMHHAEERLRRAPLNAYLLTTDPTDDYLLCCLDDEGEMSYIPLTIGDSGLLRAGDYRYPHFPLLACHLALEIPLLDFEKNQACSEESDLLQSARWV